MATIKLIDVEWRDHVPEDKRSDTLELNLSDHAVDMFEDELFDMLGDHLLKAVGEKYAEGVKRFKIAFNANTNKELENG